VRGSPEEAKPGNRQPAARRQHAHRKGGAAARIGLLIRRSNVPWKPLTETLWIFGNKELVAMVNMMKLMKQAQAMQSNMQKLQAELAERTYEFSAGGGVVKAVAKGDMTMVA
jgi:hypothetical protein